MLKFQSYQIFQLLYLLHKNKKFFDEKVNVRGSDKINFATQDIENITLDTKGKIYIDIHPLAFGECGFLLSSNFYKYFYLLWLKYNPIFSITRRDNAYIHYLSCLSQFVLDENQKEEFCFVPIFVKKQRTLSDLKNMIKSLCPFCKNVVIEPCAPIWKSLLQDSDLKGLSRLSDNAVLGNRILSAFRTIKILVRLSEDDVWPWQSNYFLFKKAYKEKINSLVNCFMGTKFCCELNWEVSRQSSTLSRIGETVLW
jgi:predicted component of type VI protein secretion system